MEKRVAWNKGRIIGQKAPLKQQEIWVIRTRLEIAKNTRELALLNLAIDSKLRGCDLVSLKVSDVMRSGEVLARTSIVQHKTSGWQRKRPANLIGVIASKGKLYS
jgi:hypothetical protein